jgi:hypothetical protein
MKVVERVLCLMLSFAPSFYKFIMYQIQLLTLCVACLLSWLLPYRMMAQDMIFQPLEQSLERLEEQHKKFADASRKDEQNDGASNLKKGLFKVCNNIRAYMKYSIDKDSLQRTIQPILKEAKRYNTKNTQKVVDELSRVLKEIEKHPSRAKGTTKGETTATEAKKPTTLDGVKKNEAAPNDEATSTPTEESDNEPEESATNNRSLNEPAIVSDAIPTEEPSTSKMPFVFGGMLLLALIVGALLVFNRLNNRLATLEQQVIGLQQLTKEQAIAGPGVDSGQTMAHIEVGQMKKRIELLESNTTDFLMIVEERLNKVEIQKGVTGQASSVTNTSNALEAKIALLEKKLQDFEPHIRQVAPPNTLTTVAVPYKQKAVESIIEAIQHFSTLSEIPKLKELCQYLISPLKLSIVAQSWEHIDLYALASITQLAYVSAFNEQLDEHYHQLRKALIESGFQVEDSRVGKNCLPLGQAENVPNKSYSTQAKLRSIEYPNYVVAAKQIENKFPKLDSIGSGTVLATLRPTISLANNGQTLVLSAGTYVVQA